MTAAEFIARAHAVTDAATPGPWETVPGAANVWRFPEDGSASLVVAGNGSQGHRTRLPDAVFIAAARTMLPAAVAAIEAVLALHVPVWNCGGNDYQCAECGADLTAAAPDCPTVRAITAALDVTP